MGGGRRGLPWWLPTPECSPPQSGSTADTIAFLFFSPCPQRALLGAIDLLFLLASFVLVLRRRRGSGADDGKTAEREPLLSLTTPMFRVTTGHYAVALGASAVTSAASTVLLALAAFLLQPAAWRTAECAFLAAHSAAHAVAAWTVASSDKRAAHPPPHLRVFWIATALGAALLSASTAIRFSAHSPLFPDDVLALPAFLTSLPLAFIAVTACTSRNEGAEQEDQNPSEPTATPYVTASLLSRAAFSWINPLVSKGNANGSLSADDVPPVAPAHRAEATHALLASNWPAASARSPVGVTLWLSFWPQLLLTAALYRKSLRLSAGARRAHGAGAIVNYMQVDAWIVSGTMHGLHDLWLMPLQIAAALLLLYSYLGPAVLMTLAVIAAVTVVTAFANKLNMTYQLGFVGVRDSRVKALAEMLSHMRVIKLHAWEETFGGKVRDLWRAEVGWLKKMILFESASTVVFSSGPVEGSSAPARCSRPPPSSACSKAP
ncbi:hypothetical protein ACQ4PT_052987 [Festuca glaucescens]